MPSANINKTINGAVLPNVIANAIYWEGAGHVGVVHGVIKGQIIRIFSTTLIFVFRSNKNATAACKSVDEIKHLRELIVEKTSHVNETLLMTLRVRPLCYLRAAKVTFLNACYTCTNIIQHDFIKKTII